MTTISTARTDAGTAAAPTASGRLRVVAVAMAGAAATIAVLVATHPWGDRMNSSSDDLLQYATLHADRDAAWASIIADGFAFAVLALCAALATCHLAQARGRVAALVGAVLAVAGGVLFAMGSFGFVTLVWFVTGAPEESSAELIAYANDQTGHLLGVEMVGFAFFTLATLILSVALVRAKAVPLVAVLGFVALTVLLFTPIPGRVIDVVQAVQMVLLGGLAVPLWRRTAG